MQFEQDLQKDCVFTLLEKLIGWFNRCFCPLQPPKVGVKKMVTFQWNGFWKILGLVLGLLKEEKTVWEEARWEKGCEF